MKFLEVVKVIVPVLGLLSMLVTLHEVDASPDRTGGHLGQQPRVTMMSHPKLVAAVCFSVLTILSIHQLIQAQGESSKDHADNKLNEDTLLKAKMTRQHQGFHECEVSYGGEADLHQHLKSCDKNPDHIDFIPIQEFKMEHLPSHYQDEDVVDWIRAWADLTCRVIVRYTSLDRPKYFPGTEKPFPFYQNRGKDFMRTGTGWVCGVYMYTEEEDVKCECEECVRPGNEIPKKARGEVHIQTVAHLVCDQTESNCSECYFHYDSSDITDMSTLLTLRGLGIHDSDIKGDFCTMKYVTHDGDLLDRLDKMWKRCVDLAVKVYDKYSKDEKNESESERDEQCEGNKGENLCVCVSHPHGCSKQVTVGTWTHRETEGKGKGEIYREDVVLNSELTRYKYTTPTCPGSSGAPVFSPVRRKMYIEKWREWWWNGLFHAHSEGRPGNDNNSAVEWEAIQSPT